MARTVCGTVALVALAALVTPPVWSAEQPELAGLYVCQGVNADSSQYRGFVQIAHHRDTLILTWRFPQAPDGALPEEPAAAGVGIVSGGTLAVSYYSTTMMAVVVYVIEQDGQRLVGQWTVAGGDGILSSETLTKLPGHIPPPAGDGDGGHLGRDKHTPAVTGTLSL